MSRALATLVLGLVMGVAVGTAAAKAQMILHSSGTCTLYAVTSAGNLHIGCVGDSTMPKAGK